MSHGIFPVCAKAQPLLIEGVTYRFRRLGLKDGFEFLGLFNDIASRGFDLGEKQFKELFHPAKQETDSDPEYRSQVIQAAITLMLGLEITEFRIYAWLSSTLGREGIEEDGVTTKVTPVTPGQLQDPEIFPLEAAVDLLAGIASHPDLESFFLKLKSQRAESNPLINLFQNQISNKESSS